MRVLWSLFLVTGVWFSHSALGAIDVSCIADSCLTEGWRLQDTNSLARGIVECMDGDCNANGWYETGFGGQTFEIYCAPRGCWVQGWEAEDRYGRLVASAQCRSGAEGETDCLTYGWTVRQNNSVVARMTCINNNCRENGWEISVRGRSPQVARCKPGGCFVEGWRLFY